MTTDVERIRNALTFLPAKDRDVWLRVGMAIKSELGEEGFAMWDSWSQSDESYDAREALRAWKSIRPDGGITIATLFHLAGRNAWSDGGLNVPADEDVTRWHRATMRADADEGAPAEERVLAAQRATALWAAGRSVASDHPYLRRKRVQPVPELREILAGDAAGIVGYCHAGCSQNDVIAALRAHGVWYAGEPTIRLGVKPDHRVPPEFTSDALSRTHAALAVWRASQPGKGTPVECYLRSRGLTIPVPPSINFHAGLKHPLGGVWPAMVALVTGGVTGDPIGIHRTFLAQDGNAKAPVESVKMMLGPCRGGAVRLGPATEPLMIGEGIETSLSAMQATGHAAWAALSTSGMRALELPRAIRDVIILADGDPPGRAAAEAAACRWSSEGRRVRIARAPEGRDFNDLLLSRLSHEGNP